MPMQEPQCATPELSRLLGRIGVSGPPCLSLMNMPPPSFLAHPQDQELLMRMAGRINDARVEHAGLRISLPVKFRLSDSVLLPFAKWSMLLAGNYRCLRNGRITSIRDAVYGRLDVCRAIYRWVDEVLRAMGLKDRHLVPFERCAKAADRLCNPSSVARGLFSGRCDVERVAKLVQIAAHILGFDATPIERIVEHVDQKLKLNRHAANPVGSLTI